MSSTKAKLAVFAISIASTAGGNALLTGSVAHANAVRPDFCRAVQPEVRKAVQPDLCRAGRPGVRKAVRPDVRKAVRPDLRKARPEPTR
jgi:hypothetical protein